MTGLKKTTDWHGMAVKVSSVSGLRKGCMPRCVLWLEKARVIETSGVMAVVFVEWIESMKRACDAKSQHS